MVRKNLTENSVFYLFNLLYSVIVVEKLSLSATECGLRFETFIKCECVTIMC